MAPLHPQQGINESIPTEATPVEDLVKLHHPPLFSKLVFSSSLTSIHINLFGLLVFLKMPTHYIISLGFPQAPHTEHILIFPPKGLPLPVKDFYFPLELEIQTRDE